MVQGTNYIRKENIICLSVTGLPQKTICTSKGNAVVILWTRKMQIGPQYIKHALVMENIVVRTKGIARYVESSEL